MGTVCVRVTGSNDEEVCVCLRLEVQVYKLAVSVAEEMEM